MNQHTFQRLYAAGQRNFRHADLRGLSLKDLDLAGADFTGAKIQGTNFRGANLTGAKFCLAKAGLHSGYIVLAIASSVLGGAIAAVTSLLLFMGLFTPGVRIMTLPILIGLVLFGYLRLPQRAHQTTAPCQGILQHSVIAFMVYALLTVFLILDLTTALPQHILMEALKLLGTVLRFLIPMHLYLLLFLLFAHLLNRNSVQTAIAIYGEKQGLYFGVLPAYSLGAVAVIGGMNFVYDVVAPRHVIPTTWIGYGCAIAVIGGCCWLMLLLALSQTRRSLHRPITQLSNSPTPIPWAYMGTTSFHQANLTKANFTGAFLVGSNFTQANLTDIRWGNAKGTTLTCGLRYSPASPQS